jgi:hypothetical protein
MVVDEFEVKVESERKIIIGQSNGGRAFVKPLKRFS